MPFEELNARHATVWSAGRYQRLRDDHRHPRPTRCSTGCRSGARRARLDLAELLFQTVHQSSELAASARLTSTRHRPGACARRTGEGASRGARPRDRLPRRRRGGARARRRELRPGRVDLRRDVRARPPRRSRASCHRLEPGWTDRARRVLDRREDLVRAARSCSARMRPFQPPPAKARRRGQPVRLGRGTEASRALLGDALRARGRARWTALAGASCESGEADWELFSGDRLRPDQGLADSGRRRLGRSCIGLFVASFERSLVNGGIEHARTYLLERTRR